MADSFNFFSDRPLDYSGNGAIERGYLGLGQGIAGGLEGIAKNNQAEKSYKMKAALEKQMKIDEEDRLHDRALTEQWASRFPGQDIPMTSDGKLNRSAIMGAVGKFDRIQPLVDEGNKYGVTRGTNTSQALPGVSGSFNATLPNVDVAGNVSPDPLGTNSGPSILEAPVVTTPQTDAQYGQAIQDKKRADALAQAKLALIQKGQEGIVTSGSGIGMSPKPTDFNTDGTVTDDYAKRVADAADERARNKTRNATLSTAQQLVATEHPELTDHNSKEYKDALNKSLNYVAAPAPYKMGMKSADGLVDAGLIPAGDKKTYDKEVLRFASFGGLTPPAPPALQKTLGDWNTLQGNQQTLLTQIDQFDKTHPEGFASYVGPWDNRLQKFNLAYNEGASEGSKEAGRILQGYQNILNQRMHDMSGTAVTASEMARNMLASGDPGGVNFVNALRGWHDATANQYENQLHAAASYQIPESLTKVGGKSPSEWVGYWKSAVPSAGAGNAVTASSSFTDADAKRLAELRAKAATRGN